MKNILLLTDLSRAEGLQENAIDLCSRLRCNLLLLNVYNGVPYVPALDASSYRAKWYSDLYDEQRERFQLQITELKKLSDALAGDVYRPMVNSIMTEGNIAGIVQHSMEKNSVELVIMGKSKSGAFAHLLFGDAISAVVAVSNCPILIIPPETKPLQNTAKVVFATDFNKNDLAACSYLSLMGSMMGFTTEVVHVKKERGINPREIERENRFVSHLQSLESHTLTYRHLLGRPVLSLLGQWSEFLGADWLALSEHHRPFLSSLFKKNTLSGALSAQQKPLLVFPEHFVHREYFSPK
ncbi:universal stress protein [Pedobacter chinensis]|uniref:Universal stress protein n=1 Tax=Pedobacter chinensis TaxID=2282421 RepID=A0A369PRK7_9SPHI|nr:universal stress protein [Pedobacter chinensis]RDC55271.1 universal stress protein [Pedobacter chinensis]